MKRIDMLDLMIQVTRTYRNDLSENSSQRDMYDKILKSMETAGMQPPKRRIIIDDSFTAIYVDEWEN